jgi:hypothetical protein
MRRLFQVFFISLLAFYSAAMTAQESRLALVIGNSEYQNAGFLLNPVNDAVDISEALRNTGFEVIEYTNLDLIGMKRAIDQFGLKLLGYDVGLFYYAGHGIQSEGVNYLVPVDATIHTKNDVEYNSVDVGRILAKMEDARSRTNIVILDACRDNPFERSWSRSTKGSGLAFMNAPSGYLIAYATSPGETASDGGGDNGLYTSAILNHIYEKDINIIQMFQKVRTDVSEVSNETQIPWESTSLKGDFYLAVDNTSIPASGGSVGLVPIAAGTAANNNTQKSGSGSNDIYKKYFADQSTPAKSVDKTPAVFTPAYFLSQTSRFNVGDSVYYNKYSSSSWTGGKILEVRNNGYYLVQYRNRKGNFKTDVVGKKNLILSSGKHLVTSAYQINVNDVVYFFTNYDKLISYGRIISIKPSGVTLQRQHNGSENHTVPLSAILIQKGR